MQTVKADPKAIAARRGQSQQTQVRKSKSDLNRANAWRKAHGLAPLKTK